ncbi:MAG: hypothetical protein E7338_05045 [Clostridiales bacterium]|nr:hypothetical protein [Clostridiales bacterium]
MAEEKVEWTPSQLEAIGSIKQNTLVSASAGSGKTSLMMEKIARMVANKDIKGLDKPMQIKNMMIVTFTKEVARELKIKVAGKLVKSIYAYPDEAEHLINQIEDISIASISTIDSLCSSIVRMYFQKADVDPAFTVMEQEEADLYFFRAVTKVLRKNDLAATSKYLALQKFLGSDLQKLIQKGYNAIRNHKDYIKYLDNEAIVTYKDFKESEVYKAFWDGVKKAADNVDDICTQELKNVMNIQEDKKREKLTGYFENIHDLCAMIKKASCIEDLISLEYKLSNTPGDSKFAVPEDEPIYKASANVYSRAKGMIESALCSITSNDKDAFYDNIQQSYEMLLEYSRLLKEIDEEYVQSKQEDNKLDFNDIEQKTLLVLSDENTKKELQDKYDYICIDEYQDINPLQDEILTSMSKGDNMFMVGDVKQSIYGFRLSDPTIFLKKYDNYKKDKKEGNAVDLNENFRSRGEIIDFVNNVFDANMTESFGGINYKKDAELEACKKKKSTGVKRVKVAIVPKAEKTVHSNIPEDGIYSPKDHVFEIKNDKNNEALYIKSKIDEFVGKVQIPTDKGPREVKYSDIAILFKARSGAMPIVSELQKLGVPIDISNAIEDSKNFATSLLISLLNVIDNEQQDIELTNVLLSVFGGFNMAELAEVRRACNGSKVPFYTAFYTCEGPNKEINAKIANFNKMIERYRFLSKFTPVDRLLEIIIEENMFDEYVLSQENGQSVLMQLYTFLNALTAKSYNASISKFLSIYREYGSIDSTKESSISTDNCVKCNTVHGSKGLEYPIVFLVDAKHRENTEKEKIIYNKVYGFAIKDYDEESSTASSSLIYDYLNANSRNTNREEAMRGLYVALTRAQEYLFVTTTSNKDIAGFNESANEPKDATSYFGLIEYASSVTNGFKEKYCEYVTDLDSDKEDDERGKFNIDEIELDDDFLGKFNKEVVDDYAYKESTITPIWHSVTQINKLPSQELAEDDFNVVYDFEEFFGKKEVTNPAAGTAYHRVLELLDFNDTYTLGDVESAIEQMVIDGLLTKEQRDKVDTNNILDCINSPLMQIAKKNRCIKEAAFKLYVPMNEVVETTIQDKILVQGTFDLFIPRSETNKEGILIDYKYSSANEKEIANTYNKQLKLYKKAIECCYGEKVDRMYIYVLGQNMQIEIIDKK